MTLRDRLAQAIFGDLIDARVKAAVKVVDDKWWNQVSGSGGPQDKKWWELRDDLEDALTAWRTNPLAFRIVALTTDYVVGAGIQITSPVAYIDDFINRLSNHRLNKLRMRHYSWCEELTRSGEVFITMHTNPADGISYFRATPAVKIDQIEADPDDLEKELRYHELRTDDPIEGKWWPAWDTAKDTPETPVMLHYAINRPVGCIRGQGDLTPLLSWLRRYREWLEDRVRVNRYKNAFLWHVNIEGGGPADIQAKQGQYAKPPSPGSVIVTDETETWTPVQPNIQAEDVKDDGKALRLMIAAGAGIPLHYLAEGESATRSTAAEMTGPTIRHYEHRQMFFCDMLLDIIEKAHYRATVTPGAHMHTPRGGLQLSYTVSDLREEDSLKTAKAALAMVETLVAMKAQGWITTRKALEIAYKFAGEIIDVEALMKELEQTPAVPEAADGDTEPAAPDRSGDS